MEKNTEKANKGGFVFDPVRLVKQCLRSWKLMCLCVVGCCVLAGAYLYIRKPLVQVDAQLMLPPESTANGFIPMMDIASSFNLDDILGGSSTENEIAVLKSHTVFEKTARDLGLNVTYLEKVRPLKWLPAYGKSQLHLQAEPGVADTISIGLRFDLSLSDDGKFDIKVKRKRKVLVKVKDVELPATVETPYGAFTISKTDCFGVAPIEDFRILFGSYNAAAYEYGKLIDIYAPNKKTDFIGMTFNTTDAQFGEKLLNAIIDNYNLIGNLQKDDNSRRTLDFVSQRMESLQDELKKSENAMEAFKKENVFVDLPADVAKSSELEARILNLQIGLEVLNMTKDFLNNPENNYAMIPTMSGLDNEVMAVQISEYNNVIAERMKLMQSAKSNNTALVKLNKQIDMMRENIDTSVNLAYNNGQTRLAKLRSEMNTAESRKSTMPTIEKEYVSMERDLVQLQQLYIYLQRQREEAELSLTKSSPSLLTIDAPYAVAEPPGLTTKMVIALAIFLGLCLGVVLVYFLRLPRRPFGTKKQILDVAQAPVLGCVARDLDEKPLADGDSQAGESIRMLRSNLIFALDECKGRVVMATSAINGEGVSYVASNLAQSMALAGYRTALVEANMRSPYLAQVFPSDMAPFTLAQALAMPKLPAMPQPAAGAPLVIAAGQPAGNPADALSSQAMAALIATLRQDFDYVIIDAPHLQGYSDAFGMAENVDLTLIVAKIGVTAPVQMQYIDKIYEDGRLPRVAIVIDSVVK